MAHWKTYLDSDVLRYVDLGDREVTVQIKKVERGKVTGSGGKSNSKAMLFFEGKEKPYGAGSVVLKTIATLYGNDTTAWVGKFITLYGDPNVTFGKDRCGGIRCRPVVPKETK